MKFSNYTFYKRHSLELERFLIGQNSLHIINEASKVKISDKFSEKIYIKPDLISLSKLTTKKFDTIIFTDIVESGQDIYDLLFSAKECLNENGKLIITSINTKYMFLIKILEKLQLKNKNISQSYVHNKKISNIASGLGFEFITTTSKQIIPFKFFGFGTLINLLLKLFYSDLSMV